MTRFGQWLKDKRWAANMRSIKRFERTLSFSERKVFYDELRPRDTSVPADEGRCIAYPDAFMFITINDVIRAMEAVVRYRIQRRNVLK